MLAPYKVRITVVKKTFNEDLVDEYTEGVTWEPKGCCHAFEIGHEFVSDGHMPEGFSDWAWTDIQKYVMTLARGGNMLGVKPGVFITNCTDGFRPVSFKLERIEEPDGKSLALCHGRTNENVTLNVAKDLRRLGSRAHGTTNSSPRSRRLGIAADASS